MNESLLKLPVGIERFQEIRKSGFYYIDKTGLIEQLLENWGKANLFTRPRRFGKTLNMSMLRCFFEIGTDPTLFDGLYISKNKRLCEEYMGKYPVLFLSLKGVEGLTFEEAKFSLSELLADEIRRFKFLLGSDKLDEEEKNQYRELLTMRDEDNTMFGMKLKFSLKRLSELLYKHYGKNTIILIDEYDVPLDKAFQYGYYREMVALIRGFLGETLKTNDFLQFAVLTGCLRVSGKNIISDSQIYCYNRRTKEYLKSLGIDENVCSKELNHRELAGFCDASAELEIYGAIPVMFSAGCIKKTGSRCDGKTENIRLTDRKGQNLTVHTVCRYCYNILYYPEVLWLLEDEKDWREIRPLSVRFSFTTETAEQCKNILDLFAGKGNGTEIQRGYTKGHFKRGVL